MSSVQETPKETPTANDVYVYLFAHPTQSNVPLPGDGKNSVTVGHATEIPYVFGNRLNPLYGEDQLAALMSSYWVRFAVTGDPNGGGDAVRWPKYNIDEDNLLCFDVTAEFGGDGVRVQEHVRENACDWQQQHRVPLSSTVGYR